MNLKTHYSQSLDALNGQLHFSAHSHHLWPNAIEQGHTQYLKDSFRLSDKKWDKILNQVMPEAQNHIAEHLKLSSPEQINFSTNTHIHIFRLLSCFGFKKKIKLLTTDSEFHSFERQIKRLEEEDYIEVTRVPTQPFVDFQDRFIATSKKQNYDLIFCSQVFFNTGFALPNLTQFILDLPEEPLKVIDGYHGFMARPTDLKPIEDRVIYIAGGYKYAQAGEGACFIYFPKQLKLRPLYTGWFADFSALEKSTEKISYAEDGMRMSGSTFDSSGLYRLNATMNWMKQENLDVQKIHKHVVNLQETFIEQLKEKNILGLTDNDLIIKQQNTDQFGHFLTFNSENASQIHRQLTSLGVLTDYRGHFLRFGFGLYHTTEDIEELFLRV